jgi:cytochrome c556
MICKRLCMISAYLFLAGAPLLPGEAAESQDVIDYRMHIMNTLNEQSEALGQILTGEIPDDNFSAHMQVIALTASIALKAFEPKVPGGNSKADVWKNWADFAKRMNDFSQKTASAAKLSREQGKDAALGVIVDALSCKGCHELYRDEKKR